MNTRETYTKKYRAIRSGELFASPDDITLQALRSITMHKHSEFSGWRDKVRYNQFTHWKDLGATTWQGLAGLLSDTLTTDRRNNGETFVKLRDNAPDWMSDVIRDCHDGKLPDDTVYDFIARSCEVLRYASDRYPEDAIAEIEADIYTHDLTAWLDERPDHVYYMTQAQEEYGPIEDGFALLMTAQKMQIDEIAFALMDALQNLIEDY